MGEGAIRTAPAVARNREPILAVLRGVLPATGDLLEIASGSGEHAEFLAAAFPGLAWHPTDRDEEALASIAARRAVSGLANLMAPAAYDIATGGPPLARADAMLSINMIHISPWRSTEGLMHCAGRLLPPGAPLVLYGPFIEPGHPLAASNAAFDMSLRSRDPSWGLRDLGEVAAEAGARGLDLAERHEMPANNLTIVFRRRA